MTRVGHFEKVSYEQFEKDFKSLKEFNAEAFPDEEIRKRYDAIKLPTRATAGSAGYDFYSTVGFEVAPGQTVKIPTGIRVQIDAGWYLGLFPRSSLGFKYRFQLDNTCGIIDSDFFYADNEGHIFAKMTNDSKTANVLSIDAGDRYMQGIFIPFGVTYDDEATEERHGGIGSSGK